MIVLFFIYVASLTVGLYRYHRVSRHRNAASLRIANRCIQQLVLYGTIAAGIILFSQAVSVAHPHWLLITQGMFAFATTGFLANVLFPKFFGLPPRRTQGAVLHRY